MTTSEQSVFDFLGVGSGRVCALDGLSNQRCDELVVGIQASCRQDCLSALESDACGLFTKSELVTLAIYSQCSSHYRKEDPKNTLHERWIRKLQAHPIWRWNIIDDTATTTDSAPMTPLEKEKLLDVLEKYNTSLQQQSKKLGWDNFDTTGNRIPKYEMTHKRRLQLEKAMWRDEMNKIRAQYSSSLSTIDQLQASLRQERDAHEKVEIERDDLRKKQRELTSTMYIFGSQGSDLQPTKAQNYKLQKDTRKFQTELCTEDTTIAQLRSQVASLELEQKATENLPGSDPTNGSNEKAALVKYEVRGHQLSTAPPDGWIEATNSKPEARQETREDKTHAALTLFRADEPKTTSIPDSSSGFESEHSKSSPQCALPLSASEYHQMAARNTKLRIHNQKLQNEMCAAETTIEQLRSQIASLKRPSEEESPTTLNSHVSDGGKSFLNSHHGEGRLPTPPPDDPIEPTDRKTEAKTVSEDVKAEQTRLNTLNADLQEDIGLLRADLMFSTSTKENLETIVQNLLLSEAGLKNQIKELRATCEQQKGDLDKFQQLLEKLTWALQGIPSRYWAVRDAPETEGVC